MNQSSDREIDARPSSSSAVQHTTTPTNTISAGPAAEEGGSPLMSVPELAAYLKVPEATVYAWRSRGQAPPCYRVGRWLRFRRDEVDDWLAGQVG